jgi:hypothetical protein
MQLSPSRKAWRWAARVKLEGDFRRKRNIDRMKIYGLLENVEISVTRVRNFAASAELI